jgi:hypothetical protein
METPALATIVVPPKGRRKARASLIARLALAFALAASLSAAAFSATAAVANAPLQSLAAEPAFTIELQQKLEGPSGSFTSSPLSAEIGQTVDYEILVKDSGNTPLTFSAVKASGCDAGTISGGLGEGPVLAGATTTYLCQHLLSLADQKAGSYRNTVSMTGTREETSLAPTFEVSNTVVVSVRQAPASSPPAAPSPSAPQPAQHLFPLPLPAPLGSVGQASGPSSGRGVPGVAHRARFARSRRARAQRLHRRRTQHHGLARPA